MKTEIIDEYARHNSVPEIIELRKSFQDNAGSACTCDNCAAVTICSLAYDLYNTNGDCIYDK